MRYDKKKWNAVINKEQPGLQVLSCIVRMAININDEIRNRILVDINCTIQQKESASYFIFFPVLEYMLMFYK